MDRFEQGLPDPQQAKVVGYCSNPSCGGEIYEGQQAEWFGDNMYRCIPCLFEAEGTVISAEGE